MPSTAHAHRHSAVGDGDDGDLVGKDSSVDSVRSSRIPLQSPSPGASAIPPYVPVPRGCGGRGRRPQRWRPPAGPRSNSFLILNAA